MSMVFKFRMLSDQSDKFVRDYEVMYDMNLLDFNDFICEDLGYEPDDMTSFFFSDAQWRKLQEYTLMDIGTEAVIDDYTSGESSAPIPMADVALGQIIHHLGDRLIWVFDQLADRAYYLELVEPSVANPEVEYPRTLFAHGAPADQFDADADGDNEKSIFDEMMDEFGDFSGDDSYDDEY